MQGIGDDGFTTLESNWSQPSKSIVGRVTSILGVQPDQRRRISRIRIIAFWSPRAVTDAGLLSQINSAFPTLFPTSVKRYPLGLPVIRSRAPQDRVVRAPPVACPLEQQRRLAWRPRRPDLDKADRTLSKFGYSWDSMERTNSTAAAAPNVSMRAHRTATCAQHKMRQRSALP